MTAFQQLLETFKIEQRTWLVTGNAGFIGSNLTEFLLKHKQKVVGLDNFSTGYQHNIDDVLSGVSEEAAKNFTFIEGDIADMETCVKACAGVDIHYSNTNIFKAQNLVRYTPIHDIYQGMEKRLLSDILGVLRILNR